MIKKIAGMTAALMLLGSITCIGTCGAEAEQSEPEAAVTEAEVPAETDGLSETEAEVLSEAEGSSEPEQWYEMTDGVCSFEDISLLQPSYIDDFLYRDIIKGDVNRDGNVDLSDLTMFSQYLLCDWEFTFEQLIAADIVCQRYSQAEPDIADFAALRQIICNDYIGLEYRPDYYYAVAR